MLTADAEFRAVANAAFDAWQKRPPYIAYRVDVDIDVSALKRSRRISRAVEARTRDDLAVIQDLPKGQNQMGHAFPVPPTFDALSYFHIDFHMSDPVRQHNPLTAVTLLPPGPNLPPQPLHFSDPVAIDPEATIVVTTLRNYYATYAPDSTDRIAHIALQALPALTRGNDSTFFLKDVYVDTATNLPTRIVYSGAAADFAVDYTTIENHWVIAHATYRGTVFAPFHIGQTSYTTDARYSSFSFPAAPTDPRLK